MAEGDKHTHTHTETSPLILLSKSMDWLLYDNGLRRERVNDLRLRKYYGSRCHRTYIISTKILGYHTFFEILDISLEIPSISNSRCKKPSISKFLIQNA